MLVRGDYAGLAERFGYARAYGREPAAAIEADLRALAAPPQALAAGAVTAIAVEYFAPNDIGMFAIVECAIGAAVLLELAVSGKGEDKQIIVDDISRVAA